MMQKIMIDGNERTISGSINERDGWTWFYVVEDGRKVMMQSVPTPWFNNPSGKIRTSGHVYEPHRPTH